MEKEREAFAVEAQKPPVVIEKPQQPLKSAALRPGKVFHVEKDLSGKESGLKPSFVNVPWWPIATCDFCHISKEKWRHMESTQHISQNKTIYWYRYRCWKCVLKNEEAIHTESTAKTFIKLHSGNYQGRLDRHTRFKQGLKRKAEHQ